MDEITPNGDRPRLPRMEARLRAVFTPTILVLRDESHLHAGHLHKEDREEIETHVRLTIAAPQLEGLTRVAQQRLINQALADEFASGLHALAIKIVD